MAECVSVPLAPMSASFSLLVTFLSSAVLCFSVHHQLFFVFFGWLQGSYFLSLPVLCLYVFSSGKSQPMSPGSAISTGCSNQDRLDRFRLVLGLAVKALCLSISEQPPNSQEKCVQVGMYLMRKMLN